MVTLSTKSRISANRYVCFGLSPWNFAYNTVKHVPSHTIKVCINVCRFQPYPFPKRVVKVQHFHLDLPG